MVGSSIVYWAARSTGGRIGGSNLGLQSKGFILHWYGKRGMKWAGLVPTIECHLQSNPPPSILVIQLGSNDLGFLKGKELIESVRLDILRLRVMFPTLMLVWSEILPRRYWHFEDKHGLLEITRKRVNLGIKKIFLEEGGYIIRHPNIKVAERNLFRYDGTHLSEIGNTVYLNSIQGALESFTSSSNHTFPPL